MEDKEARKDIEWLKDKLGRQSIIDVSIKDCPKCKHPVMSQWNDSHYCDLTPQDVVIGTMKWTPAHFQCLTCGTKFTCSEKCVCEEIK